MPLAKAETSAASLAWSPQGCVCPFHWFLPASGNTWNRDKSPFPFPLVCGVAEKIKQDKRFKYCAHGVHVQ